VMAAILNGMSLSHVRPYGAGFLIFSDYARASIRLSAIMEIPTIHVFTHDSIGVGEDGPTHQPIEQLASLRAVPGMHIFRPGDANEMVEAWKVIMKFRHEPALLLASRQPIPVLDRTKFAPASGVAKGGYILADAEGGKPDVILIASGTEVPLSVEAYEKLKVEGVKARVVSLACWELFAAQDQSYRDSVLPPSIKARVNLRLGTVCGAGRQDCGYAHVWRFGSTQRPAEAFRVYCRRRCRSRERRCGEGPVDDEDRHWIGPRWI